jgi:hypothetical protein
MELSTTQEATSYEIVPILSQTNPVYTTTFYLSKINLSVTQPFTFDLPSGVFPSGHPTNNL